MSNQRLLLETKSKSITSIVCLLPELFLKGITWIGGGEGLWLGQVDDSSWELLGMGKELAWDDGWG